MPRAALPATGSVSVSVAAPPEAVWPFVSDPGTPARFSDELYEATLADDGAPREGSVIVGRNKNGDFSWTTESVVTDCVAPTTFGWATGARGAPTATWAFVVKAADGGSILIHEVVLHDGVPPLGPAIDAEPDRAHEIVGARMTKVLASMTATVTGIAGLAEAAGAVG